MRYLLSAILLFVSSLVMADETLLTIKCPENLKVVINSQTQPSTGSVRKFSFDIPKDKSLTTHIFTYYDGNNLVVNSVDVTLVGGVAQNLDFRVNPPKDEEVKPVPAPVIPKVNFQLFGTSKPNFSMTGTTKIEPPKKVVPKEDNVPVTKIQIKAIQSPQIQYNIQGSDCSTGQCSTRR